MRRPEFAMSQAEARHFLTGRKTLQLAFAPAGGPPVLRTLHPVVVGDAVAFHGSPAGEKTLCAGMPVVLQAEEVVASVPSYFVHPERACPATTLYRSVQVSGTVEEVADPPRKAAILQALMEKLQPEGGHRPITADDLLYRAAVAGIWIFQVSLAEISGKAKLGQNRTPDELAKLLEALWHRGDPGDTRAIELVREANPLARTPEFLSAPAGTKLHCWLDPALAAAAADLLAGTYWNTGVSREELLAAHLGASAWVGAHDASGALVASARAVSDSAKCAWVYDVVVAEGWRGRGLGKALVRLLLAHPALRAVRATYLGTRDAEGLYARFGFVDRRSLPAKPYHSTEMVLVRHDAARHGRIRVLA
ncbi:MAG: GNAT family N-acetyltransferase [Candidatus Sericytochromatia bacterium]|nr:GNAT family N-acetyltransferase [Candidatus Tanganyikabacteria bacterium]